MLIGEKHEGRRPDARLGDVVDLDRRLDLQSLDETIEFAGCGALGGRLETIPNQRENLLHSNALRRGEEGDGSVVKKLELVPDGLR